MSVEGVISKRIDAPYQSGRKGTWTKTKCMGRQEFVVAGYTDPAGSRTGFGALLLAVNDGEGRLVYCGKVGTGFDTRTLARLLKLLKALETTNPSIVNSPWGRRARGIHWVRPKMVVEVEFREWTTEGILRQPSFKGVREDKGPGEVKRELPAASVDAAASHERPPAASVERARTVGGVRISHPNRLVFPKQGLTKAALAEYYERVADWILPHIVNRPLSIVRCPKGHGEDCFYQKHLEEGWPEYVYGVEVQEEGGERETHLTIRDLKGLISLVQFGMLEVHPWGSRVEMIERPDRLVFDLDPGPGVPWKQVVDAAFHMRSVLDGLGLKSFPRTTGGKGLHVLLPIERRYGWDEVKSFCRKVAEHVRDDDSGLYVVNIRKERRKGKILVDYLRNSRGATAVASYSTRARPGATVAVNMSWEDLRSVTSPDAYTVKNLPARLEALREDPWADLPGIHQGITRSALTRLTRRR
jgi:bifunctional non-homologous end joining protein LigD